MKILDIYFMSSGAQCISNRKALHLRNQTEEAIVLYLLIFFGPFHRVKVTHCITISQILKCALVKVSILLATPVADGLSFSWPILNPQIEKKKKNFFSSFQDREQELEQLTKELRQVNLQQFIQQTGTKVTVLPAEPTEVEASHADIERGKMLKNLLLFPSSPPSTD